MNFGRLSSIPQKTRNDRAFHVILYLNCVWLQYAGLCRDALYMRLTRSPELQQPSRCPRTHLLTLCAVSSSILCCYCVNQQQKQPSICDIWLPTSYWVLQPRIISRATELLSISVTQIYDWVHVHRIPSHRRPLLCKFFRTINFGNLISLTTTNRHSSSSAIFERDIEPLIPPSPPGTHHHPPNPHRIPRSKGTEQLENSVPSVLDSAAAVLAGLEDVEVGDQVAVVSPASPNFDKGRSSGFASPIGSFSSRSPSPLGVRIGVPPQSRAEILLNLPTVPHAAAVSSPTCVLGLHNITSPPSLSPTHPAITTSNIVTQLSHDNSTTDAATSSPSILTPTSAYFSTVSNLSTEPSPTTTTVEHPPNLPSPILSLSNPVALPQSIISSPVLASTSLSLPPSPQLGKKRLSFMSYSDLLSSTPTSTQPLSSLTTCASSTEPPPHIPGVSGLNIANAMQPPLHHPGNGSIPGSPFIPFSGHGGLMHVGKRDSIAMLDNAGGEWEREGLGRGLEERLEALVIPGALITSPVVYPVVWSFSFWWKFSFSMLLYYHLIFFQIMLHPIIPFIPCSCYVLKTPSLSTQPVALLAQGIMLSSLIID